MIPLELLESRGHPNSEAERNRVCALQALGYKPCIRCSKIKPLSLFYVCRQQKTGYDPYCKACHKERHAERLERIPYRMKARSMLSDIRNRSRKADIPCDLTLDWLEPKLEKGVCEVTGIKLEPSTAINNPLSPSVDRIFPAAGYLQENCRLVCLGYNMLRGNGTDETAMLIAKALVGQKRSERCTVDGC